MSKIIVLQQSLSTQITGGTSSEFLALNQSALTEKYEFIPAVLEDYKAGISLHDILFYYRRIKEVKPDIIHIRGAGPDGLNAVIGAKLAGKVKILLTVHGMYSDLVYVGKGKHFLSKHVIERLSFSMADGISCVCRTAEQRPYFDRYRKKMLPYVYNRIPKFDNARKQQFFKEVREELGIAQSALVGLYVGRVTKEKGLDYLITALKSVQGKLPEEFVLVIVGDGDYLQQMKNDAKTCSARMVFTGGRSDVERFYHAADFFIQPSLHENHSIALLEACAAQLPAIATNCGGNAEIISDEITGLVIPSADADELGKAILKMCHSDLRAAMRDRIRASAYAEFSDSEVDKVLDKVYQLLLKQK